MFVVEPSYVSLLLCTSVAKSVKLKQMTSYMSHSGLWTGNPDVVPYFSEAWAWTGASSKEVNIYRVSLGSVYHSLCVCFARKFTDWILWTGLFSWLFLFIPRKFWDIVVTRPCLLFEHIFYCIVSGCYTAVELDVKLV